MENQCSRNNDSEKKQIKFFGIIGAGVFIFICLCITLPLIFGIPESGSNEPQSNNVKLLMDTCGVTEEQANGIENILANFEITKIDEIKHDSLLDDMIEMGDRGYRVEAHGVKNIILYVSQEGEARAVRHAFSGEPRYTRRKGNRSPPPTATALCAWGLPPKSGTAQKKQWRHDRERTALQTHTKTKKDSCFLLFKADHVDLTDHSDLACAKRCTKQPPTLDTKHLFSQIKADALGCIMHNAPTPPDRKLTPAAK